MNTWRKSFWIGSLICALAAALFGMPPADVRADIGLPPVNPSGSSLEAPEGQATNVRMESEEVSLTIESFTREVPAGEQDGPGYRMRGLVEAVFKMRNLGESDESLEVWFPLAAQARYPGVLSYWPDRLVSDFQVWVDGLPTAVTQVPGPDLLEPSVESTWATFPAAFPAGKEVVVRVNYTIYPTGRSAFGSFEYILQTGAGWRDTIGRAVITITIPDTITPENVSLSGTSIEGYPLGPQPEGYSIENNVIRWELTDLEPTAADNIFVDVLDPQRYRALVQARARGTNEYNAVDAQLNLARAARDAVLVLKDIEENGGGAALAEEANSAYRRAIELAPNRAGIYEEYAEWLLRSGGFISLMHSGVCPPELCALVAAGLERFPTDQKLLQMDEQIRQLQVEAADYATQTAAGQATQAAMTLETSTAAAQPTATQAALPAGPVVTEAPPAQAAATSPLHTLLILGLALILIAGSVLLFAAQGSSRKGGPKAV